MFWVSSAVLTVIKKKEIQHTPGEPLEPIMGFAGDCTLLGSLEDVVEKNLQRIIDAHKYLREYKQTVYSLWQLALWIIINLEPTEYCPGDKDQQRLVQTHQRVALPHVRSLIEEEENDSKKMAAVFAGEEVRGGGGWCETHPPFKNTWSQQPALCARGSEIVFDGPMTCHYCRVGLFNKHLKTQSLLCCQRCFTPQVAAQQQWAGAEVQYLWFTTDEMTKIFEERQKVIKRV